MTTKKLLIIGFVWPEPDSSAAGSRMMQLIRMFRENNFDIVFASTAADSNCMFDLEVIGVKRQSILLNDASFDDFIKEMQPDIVLFDRFMTEEQFGWRVADNCPDALRILDTEDLHCLRQARHLALKENRTFKTTDLFSEIAKREIASIFRSDLALIISEVEMQLLEEVFKVGSQKLYYLPFLLERISENAIKSTPSFEEREGFVFVGNFHHEPNRDAVKYLKNAIWPLLKSKFPEAKMNIYGAYIPPATAQLHQSSSGFFVHGRADIATTVVQENRVVLAALRFGAGIKGKLTEAMICGTPSVTTSIGSESMHGELPWSGSIQDDADYFAETAIQLYHDKALWEQAQRNGVEIINKRYWRGDFEADFLHKLAQLQSDLKRHRLQDFIGEMLLHHSMSSTKYMSRWITEKNRRSTE